MAYIGQAPTPLPLTATDIPDLPATKITSGTFPALNGSNLTNLDAADLTGTLPAISGANLTGIASTLVKTGSLTSTTDASDYNLDSVFSATYLNYFVTFKFAIATDGNQCHLRFRTGGSSNTTSSYQSGTRIIDMSASFDTESNSNGNSAVLGTSLEATDSKGIQGFMYINSPFSTSYFTMVQTHFNLQTSAGTKKFCFGGIMFEGTTSFDGFQLSANTGNGSFADIHVYGIKE